MEMTNSEQPSRPDPDIVDLVDRVLDREASLDDIARLNALLPQDPAVLRYFVEMRMMHDRLERMHGTVDEEAATALRELKDASVSTLAFPARRGGWRRWSGIAAVLTLAAALGVLVERRLVHPALYQIVASRNAEGNHLPVANTWVRKSDRIELRSGVIELRSPDGNSLTLQGPAELTVEGRSRLTLERGRLWADLEGAAIKVRTSQGEVSDLGTVFGIDESTPSTTRIDVLVGAVRLRDPADPARSADARQGEGLVAENDQWPPARQPADFSRYTAGLRSSVGVCFVKGEREKEHIATRLPFATRWTTLDSPTGTATVEHTDIVVRWAGDSLYSEGGNASPEAAVFHTHLQGWRWPDRIRRMAEELELPSDGFGNVIRFDGLEQWMKSIGAVGYSIEVDRNTGVPNGNFLPLALHDAGGRNPQLLETFETSPDGHFGPNHPDKGDGIGVRTVNRLPGPFTMDSFLLTTPVQPRASTAHRANIAAVRVIPRF